MQQTRTNCFGSRKRNMTLLQAKTSKNECRNITATHFGTRAYLFSLEGRVTVFWPETIVVNFLHLMMLFYKVIINHVSKRQFVVLLCCNIYLLLSELIFNVTKVCNHKSIQLWNFSIFTYFEASWVHLCYFNGDAWNHVCEYMSKHYSI